MNVELFVHGVPQGEDFWGKEEDRKYFGTFYDGNAADKVRFLVQTRLSNGKLYCYYNYLVYENVVANDWRPNSYFGISLRFDQYCKDVLNIYRILDSSYNFHIIGNILKIEKSKLKYAVSGFSSVAGFLKNVESGIIEQLGKVLTPDSVVELNGFPKNAGNAPECNLYEYSQESLLAAMRQYGAVALSPYYSNSKEKKAVQQSQQKIEEIRMGCDNAIKQAKDECTKQRKAISDELAAAKSEIQQCQQAISVRDAEIRRRDEELARLREESRKKEVCKSLAEIVAPIKKPIHDLAESIQRIAPEKPQSEVTQYPPQEDEKSRFGKLWQGFVGFLHKYLNTILLVLILFLLFVQYSSKPAGITEQEIEKITTEIVQAIRDIAQHPSQPESIGGEGSSVGDGVQVDLSNVRIDIVGYSGTGAMEKRKEYKVCAIDGVAEGTWEVKGGETVTDTGDPNMIYVTPTEDSVKIVYRAGMSTKIRELKAR